MFSTTLEGKKATVDGIQLQADSLQEEDGRKKNGTSDVESRYVARLHVISGEYHSTSASASWSLTHTHACMHAHTD